MGLKFLLKEMLFPVMLHLLSIGSKMIMCMLIPWTSKKGEGLQQVDNRRWDGSLSYYESKIERESITTFIPMQKVYN